MMNLKSSGLVTAKPKTHGLPRSKVTYDLIPGLSSRVQAIAQQLGCSQSDVAIHLLAKGLMAFEAGQMNLRAIRRPHVSKHRFAYKLPPPRLPVSATAATQHAALLNAEGKESTR